MSANTAIHILPGTVIANFVPENGTWKYPNKKGWHSGIYKQNGRDRVMPNGLPCKFTMVDQWPGQRVQERGLASATPALIKRTQGTDCLPTMPMDFL
jgi:hypothetical protein